MKQKDGISAIALGLAIASKWSAIWTIPILFLLWLKRENKLKISTYLAFIILPITVYLLSYF
jgi:predicted membrane-bound dolichyl-phosphate-mannose-protein mannosyltransferase